MVHPPGCAPSHLVTHGALEAARVPLVAARQLLLRRVHRLATLGALGHLHRFEGHPGGGQVGGRL